MTPRALALPLLLFAACGRPQREAAAPSATERAGPVAPGSVRTAEPPPTTAVPFAVPDAFTTTTGAEAPHQAPTVRADTLPILAPADSGDFAAVALAELADLDPRVTPTGWLRAHPDDALSRGDAEPAAYHHDDLDGDWCVLARRRFRLPDGRAVLRSALFFPPPPADSLRLPPIREDGRADLEECRLGAIRVESETDESDTSGVAAARGLRRAFARRLGPPDTLRPARWPLSDYESLAAWRYPGRWVFAGWRGYHQGIEAGAWAALSGMDPAREPTAALPRTGPSFAELADSAALDPDLERDLRALRDSAAVERAGRRDWSPAADSALVDALRRWHAALAELPAEQRAAALWLGDDLVAAAYGRTAADEAGGGPLRRQLDELGVRSAEFPISHEFGYAGNLRWEAHAAAPPGPLRQDLFLELLAEGLEDRPPCGRGVDQFSRVIEQGEKALPDIDGDERLARLHLLLARAYGDVVAVASRIEDTSTYLDPADYLPRAREARHKALEHYQAALDLLAPGPIARTVWREAWRLRANLPPRNTFFVCIYD